jgi:hypothetical protein
VEAGKVRSSGISVCGVCWRATVSADMTALPSTCPPRSCASSHRAMSAALELIAPAGAMAVTDRAGTGTTMPWR